LVYIHEKRSKDSIGTERIPILLANARTIRGHVWQAGHQVVADIGWIGQVVAV
jgi:hypothetical protein